MALHSRVFLGHLRVGNFIIETVAVDVFSRYSHMNRFSDFKAEGNSIYLYAKKGWLLWMAMRLRSNLQDEREHHYRDRKKLISVNFHHQ